MEAASHLGSSRPVDPLDHLLAEAEEDAEEIVFVDGWVDDGLTDDVDQFGPELVEAFFKPDQRQDGVIDLSEGKTD